jgi:rubrerythrin
MHLQRVIETYRGMVRHFGDRDLTTRVMLERILAQEEEHANDMHDLLVSREGRPTATFSFAAHNPFATSSSMIHRRTHDEGGPDQQSRR